MIQSINSNASYYTSAIRQNTMSSNVSKNTEQTGTSFSLNGFNDDSTDDSSSGIVSSFDELMKMMQGHRMPPPPDSVDTSADSDSSIQASSGLTSSTGATESDRIADIFDTDGDGSISADEYENLISQLGMTDSPDSESIFAQFDADSDGEITLDEMLAQKPEGPPPLNEINIDSDGDNMISSDEYDNLVSQLGLTDVTSAEDFFNKFDTDSDGEITLDEIKSGKESMVKEYASQFGRLADNTINAYETNYNFMYQNGLSDVSTAV